MVSPSTTFSTSAVVATGSAAAVGGEMRMAVATTAMAAMAQMGMAAIDLTVEGS